MTPIQGYSPNLAAQLEFNLSQSGPQGKIAETLGNKMNDLEGKLIDAYSQLANSKDGKDTKSLEATIQQLDLQYKRSARVMEAFMQLMRNMHEMMMRGIQNLSLR